MRKEKKVYPEHRRRVFVAMSGGVDSSVSAVLLKKDGFNVTGVFMNVWQPDFLTCSRGDDRREAMRVAAHIGIPFLTFDFEKEYKKQVVDYMISEYRSGRTPNPDVMCNKHIKFNLFLKKARALGADFIATGHYAKVAVSGERLATSKNKKTLNPKRYALYASRDKNKDQSYFLWTLGQGQLRYTLFPVGGLIKPNVRKLAQKFGLSNALREESQGVCFIGEFNMKDFLKHYVEEKEGNVLNEAGEAIGTHVGAFFYTIGERHGFTIRKKTPHDKAYYVIGKDIKKNTVIISYKKISEKSSAKEVNIQDVNFVSGKIPDTKKIYKARIRYRQPLQECRIVNYKSGTKGGASIKNTLIHNSKFTIQFKEPQIIAPGQSLVLYDRAGEVCLGGGIIA